MNANKNLHSVILSEVEGSCAASPACSTGSRFFNFAQNDKLCSHVFICVACKDAGKGREQDAVAFICGQ